MPNYTTNYNLKKPLPNENYNIEDHNQNMDIVDQQLKVNADEIATKETPAGAQAKANAAETNAKSHANGLVGSLSSLLTTAKTNIVAAINEVFNKAEDVEDNLVTHKAENATLSALGHVIHGIINVTLDTTWSGTSAPFSKTVTVSGILSTDTPIIDVIMSGTYSTDEARIEAWGYIYRAVTDNDSITFYATEKPTVSLPIQIKVVR